MKKIYSPADDSSEIKAFNSEVSFCGTSRFLNDDDIKQADALTADLISETKNNLDDSCAKIWGKALGRKL